MSGLLVAKRESNLPAAAKNSSASHSARRSGITSLLYARSRCSSPMRKRRALASSISVQPGPRGSRPALRARSSKDSISPAATSVSHTFAAGRSCIICRTSGFSFTTEVCQHPAARTCRRRGNPAHEVCLGQNGLDVFQMASNAPVSIPRRVSSSTAASRSGNHSRPTTCGSCSGSDQASGSIPFDCWTRRSSTPPDTGPNQSHVRFGSSAMETSAAMGWPSIVT